MPSATSAAAAMEPTKPYSEKRECTAEYSSDEHEDTRESTPATSVSSIGGQSKSTSELGSEDIAGADDIDPTHATAAITALEGDEMAFACKGFAFAVAFAFFIWIRSYILEVPTFLGIGLVFYFLIVVLPLKCEVQELAREQEQVPVVDIPPDNEASISMRAIYSFMQSDLVTADDQYELLRTLLGRFVGCEISVDEINAWLVAALVGPDEEGAEDDKYADLSDPMPGYWGYENTNLDDWESEDDSNEEESDDVSLPDLVPGTFFDEYASDSNDWESEEEANEGDTDSDVSECERDSEEENIDVFNDRFEELSDEDEEDNEEEDSSDEEELKAESDEDELNDFSEDDDTKELLEAYIDSTTGLDILPGSISVQHQALPITRYKWAATAPLLEQLLFFIEENGSPKFLDRDVLDILYMRHCDNVAAPLYFELDYEIEDPDPEFHDRSVLVDLEDVRFMLEKLLREESPPRYLIEGIQNHGEEFLARYRSRVDGDSLFHEMVVVEYYKAFAFKNTTIPFIRHFEVNSLQDVEIIQAHLTRRHRDGLECTPDQFCLGNDPDFRYYATSEYELTIINKGCSDDPESYNWGEESVCERLIDLRNNPAYAKTEMGSQIVPWLYNVDEENLVDAYAYLPCPCGGNAANNVDIYRKDPEGKPSLPTPANYVDRLEFANRKLGKDALAEYVYRKIAGDEHFEHHAIPRSQKIRQTCDLHETVTDNMFVLVDTAAIDLNTCLSDPDSSLPAPGLDFATRYDPGLQLPRGCHTVPYEKLAPRCIHGGLHAPIGNSFLVKACAVCCPSGEKCHCVECGDYVRQLISMPSVPNNYVPDMIKPDSPYESFARNSPSPEARPAMRAGCDASEAQVVTKKETKQVLSWLNERFEKGGFGKGRPRI